MKNECGKINPGNGLIFLLTYGGMDLDLNEKRKLWIEHELGVGVKSMRRLYGGISSLIYEVETEKGSYRLAPV